MGLDDGVRGVDLEVGQLWVPGEALRGQLQQVAEPDLALEAHSDRRPLVVDEAQVQHVLGDVPLPLQLGLNLLLFFFLLRQLLLDLCKLSTVPFSLGFGLQTRVLNCTMCILLRLFLQPFNRFAHQVEDGPVLHANSLRCVVQPELPVVETQADARNVLQGEANAPARGVHQGPDLCLAAEPHGHVASHKVLYCQGQRGSILIQLGLLLGILPRLCCLCCQLSLGTLPHSLPWPWRLVVPLAPVPHLPLFSPLQLPGFQLRHLLLLMCSPSVPHVLHHVRKALG
mmetsp:Transcript_62184/g.140075  ORF Transcript_62184/g.140075 Transcript_62184/m.140075 type:complete len:284 (+) Transcript_62184:182-1033(+)